MSEQRLFHLDRILFGSNTILVFKYPLLNRKHKEVRSQITQERGILEEEQLEAETRKILIQNGLIDQETIKENMREDEDEDQVLQRLMKVEDYSEDEIQEDINLVDWDFAYNEILKFEDRKKVKYTIEADKKA